jgi:hypothetical protein
MKRLLITFTLVSAASIGCLCAGCDGRPLDLQDGASPSSDPDGDVVIFGDAGRAAGDALASDLSVSEPRFMIHFFDEHLTTTYDYAKLENATQHLHVDDAKVAISEEDVATYRVGAMPSTRIQLDLTAEAAKRWGPSLRAMTDNQPFLVTLDGKLLYAGVVYLMYGAAALDIPVVHIPGPFDKETEPFELKIGANQGAWMGWGKGDAERIDRQEMRDLFEARGALSTLAP